MAEIIVTAVLAIAVFFGGYFTGRAHEVNNYYDVDNVQQTDVQNRTQTDVFQGQVTVVAESDGKTWRNVNVNLNSVTNIQVEFETNRSHFTVTNGVTNRNR